MTSDPVSDSRPSLVVLSRRTVLFFEFFPAFVAVVGVIAAIVLYARDREARDSQEPEDPIAPKREARPDDNEGPPGLRPSMRA